MEIAPGAVDRKTGVFVQTLISYNLSGDDPEIISV